MRKLSNGGSAAEGGGLRPIKPQLLQEPLDAAADGDGRIVLTWSGGHQRYLAHVRGGVEDGTLLAGARSQWATLAVARRVLRRLRESRARGTYDLIPGRLRA